MSDTKINIEVVCDEHPTEKLETMTEPANNFYAFRLRVSKCPICDTVTQTLNAKEEEDVIKSAKLVFNESNLTSQTIEV